MKNKLLYLSLGLILTFAINESSAQVLAKIPMTSQKSTISQTVGVTEMSITYHRPAAKGRKVWGNLIPYDGGNPIPWRVGANETTIFTTSHDIEIAGKKLLAGTYGLHMIASEDNATLIFNSQSIGWGSFQYNPQFDVIKAEGKIENLEKSVEYLTINFNDMEMESCNLELIWGNRKMTLRINIDSKEYAFQSLANQLKQTAGFNWLGYNEAAQFCFQNEIHLDVAERWAFQSVRSAPNSTNMLLLSRIRAKNESAEDQNAATMKHFKSLLSTFPVTFREYNAAAAFSLNTGASMEDGLAFARKSMEMNKNFNNQLNEAMLLIALGQTEEGNKAKNTLLTTASNAALNQYAYQLLFNGREKESLEFFEANAKNNPEDPNVFDSLGEAYFRNGMEKEAKEAFKTSLSLNPPANVKMNTMNFLNQMGVSPEDL